MATATTVVDYQMLIGGKWVDASDGARLESKNPYNQQTWSRIAQASTADVQMAVQAANDAFVKTWKRTSGLQRATLMNELARLLEEDAPRMGRLETTDNGKVIRETEGQIKFSARIYRYFAGLADKLDGEVLGLDNLDLFDYTTYEPLGAVALIVAWNSPMQLLANKLAPALCAGTTVVIKPSEHASATTLEFAKIAEKAGFPPGVINVITGDGRVGDALTKAKGIAKISFTGGTHTARLIAKNAAERLVPVVLELGGKSPNIIFADANMPRAITGALAGIFAASGQTCIAGSRLLVERPVYAQVVEELAKRAKQIKLGDPLQAETEMGPAANEVQFDRIVDYFKIGASEGAQLVAGGKRATGAGLERGLFVEPTIFSEVSNNMRIAQEEVFGPILSIIPFDDEAQAIEIANGTEYGLASGIWTQNLSRAHRVAREITAGTVWINTYRSSAAQAPFGGTKQSGYGRERGKHSVQEYLQVKNVMIDLSDEARDPFAMKT